MFQVWDEAYSAGKKLTATKQVVIQTGKKFNRSNPVELIIMEHEHTFQKYTCPMHPGEQSNTPGKCSKCGMALTQNLSPKEKMKMEVIKIYACPMHPDITSDKPGKCSKCNMDLKEKKEEHSNHQH